MGQCLITRKGGTLPKNATVLHNKHVSSYSNSSYTLTDDYTYVFIATHGSGTGDGGNASANISLSGTYDDLISADVQWSAAPNNDMLHTHVIMNAKKGLKITFKTAYQQTNTVIGIK